MHLTLSAPLRKWPVFILKKAVIIALKIASFEGEGRGSGTFEGLRGRRVNDIFEEWREKPLWLK